MSDEVVDTPTEESLSVWAKNQVALAEALGCARETIQRWIKLKDPECPGRSSDGRYNITLWRLWVEKKGKRPAARLGDDKGALEIENLRLKNAKLEMENAQTRGQLLDIDEAMSVLGDMVRAAYENFRGAKHTLAGSVVGVSIAEASKRIGHDMDERLRTMSLGEWTKKKPFWATVSAMLGDLQRNLHHGDGLNEM